ncbi:hypothetical protein MBRA1_001697 [Malassezia brasiliensis]|uniref:Mediator of RNA polymerase II transcription subunit 13 n=1 Tax=Malassezia brasiliensis TaxID=1821822 RepID=A0AAF0IPL0_9BASI|nr:hypothetical protein MBRA1_001697 [Malassezia brasiliensis]
MRFLEAVQVAVADAYVDSTDDAVRCSAGVFLPLVATLVRFRAHTTQTSLVVCMDTEAMPWQPLATEYEAGDTSVARPEEKPVVLLPSLVPATFLGAVPYTSTPSSVRLSEALKVTLSQTSADATALCRVRVLIQAPPSGLPTDALDMGLDLGHGTISVTLSWPAALCLQRMPSTSTSETLAPLREQSVMALLEAARAPRVPPSPSHAPLLPDVQKYGPGAPLTTNDLDDDVFQGIGQLTEDDFRFFDGPSEAPSPHNVPLIQGPGAPEATARADVDLKSASELDTELPSASEADAEVATATLPQDAPSPPPVSALAPPPLPVLKSSSPVYTPGAWSPERSLRLADKYDVYGKFYTPTALRDRKRAHSFEADERRTTMRLSPRTSTPQSVVLSSPSTHASPSDSSASSDEEPDVPLTMRAALLYRLHTSAWAPPPTLPSYEAAPASELARLASAALGHVHEPTARAALPAWDALTTPCAAVPLATPRLLVGCQRAVVEVDASALDAWPTLGLEPVDGPKRMHVAAVLVGDVDAAAVREWLVGLQRVYTRLYMGKLSSCDVYVLRNAQLEHTTGQPAALVDAFQAASPADARAVLVVYAPDSQHAAEQTYEMWHRAHSVLPIPRAAVQPAATQHPAYLAQQVHALYNAAARAHSQMRPTAALAPSHYDSCRYLRPRCALRLDVGDGPHEVLQHGAVLHVAYEVRTRARGACVRVVGIDDRAQRSFLHTWSATDAEADITRVWDTARTEMHAAFGVAWHVIISRAGPMPPDEVRAWAALDTSGALRRDRCALDVVIVCVELGAPLLPCATLDGAPHAVLAGERMAILQDPLVLAQRTAYVCGHDSADAWTVHLVHVLAVDPARPVVLEAYMVDIVIHLAAMQHVTTMRWPTSRATAMPWHLAILMCS